MDRQTIDVYNSQARDLSAQYRSLHPDALLDTVRGFFHRGGETADIGCGSGRDVAWLQAQGFDAIGYDASPNMLACARTSYPDCSFIESALPDLRGVADARFANILCSGVLMHVPRSDLISAVFNLARVLRSDGRLILSYRASRSDEEREPDGRLFTSITTGKLVLLLESVGFRIAATTQMPDPPRPDIEWTVVIAEKGPLDHARGLERIQSILVQDAKTATYKLALIRAFCQISRTESNLVHWGRNEVYVPMLPVAVHWLAYYWPILTAPTFIAQKHGESARCGKPIAFRSDIQALCTEYHRLGFPTLQYDIESHPERFARLLKKMAKTIAEGPVTFSGSIHDPVFRFTKNLPEAANEPAHGNLGWICVPDSIWLDICRFDYWIEHSVIIRWAQLTLRMNPDRTFDQILPYLMVSPVGERDTSLIRSLLLNSHEPLECVWTGRTLDRSLHIDHAIPYAAWGNNDYWNMLPCHNQANLQKSDAVPAQTLIRDRADCIINYWRSYRERFETRFDLQISRALGCRPGNAAWEIEALAGFQETAQRISATRGLTAWRPGGQGESRRG